MKGTAKRLPEHLKRPENTGVNQMVDHLVKELLDKIGYGRRSSQASVGSWPS